MPGRVFPKKEGADGTPPQAKVTQPQTQEDNKDELMAPPLAATLAADATHQKEAVQDLVAQDLVADVEHHVSDLIDLAQHALDHAQIGHIRKGMKLVGAYWRSAEICAYWRERANIKETQERKRMLEYAPYCAKVEFLETFLAEWILSVEQHLRADTGDQHEAACAVKWLGLGGWASDGKLFDAKKAEMSIRQMTNAIDGIAMAMTHDVEDKREVEDTTDNVWLWAFDSFVEGSDQKDLTMDLAATKRWAELAVPLKVALKDAELCEAVRTTASENEQADKHRREFLREKTKNHETACIQSYLKIVNATGSVPAEPAALRAVADAIKKAIRVGQSHRAIKAIGQKAAATECEKLAPMVEVAEALARVGSIAREAAERTMAEVRRAEDAAAKAAADKLRECRKRKKAAANMVKREAKAAQERAARELAMQADSQDRAALTRHEAAVAEAREAREAREAAIRKERAQREAEAARDVRISEARLERERAEREAARKAEVEAKRSVRAAREAERAAHKREWAAAKREKAQRERAAAKAPAPAPKAAAPSKPAVVAVVPLASATGWVPAARATDDANDDNRSVVTVATAALPLPQPTAHVMQRAGERELDRHEVQWALKHGDVVHTSWGADGAPVMLHLGRAGGVDVVTDADATRAITAWPARAGHSPTPSSPTTLTDVIERALAQQASPSPPRPLRPSLLAAAVSTLRADAPAFVPAAQRW